MQLGLHPARQRDQVELRGQRIVYTLDTLHGRTEHGPEDILHVKAMSLDGLRGLSPVTQCRVALGLSSSLQESARQFFDNGSKPSGILTRRGQQPRSASNVSRRSGHERHAGVENMHRVAVLAGDVKFTPDRLQRRRLTVPTAARAERP